MCGIVALYSTEAGTVERSLVETMRDTMEHRGPDDAGVFVDDHVGLGHRRLSILDLSEAGHQPMCDTSGRTWLCYNGEIYNFPELRAELESKGYPFRSHCDAEVILALYATQGEDALASRLNGIFAFALWDSVRGRLLLVRDRVGVKPLYLWQSGGLFAAASEVKALLAHPKISRRINSSSIAEYLAFRQVSGGRTLFDGIDTVAPGEMVAIQNGICTRRSYWSLPRSGEVEEGHRGADLVSRLDELLQDATHRQMLSDVPLGTFSSGGVDSSLITSYVSEKATEKLSTFNIGLDDPDYDERPFADLIARQFDTRHHSLVVNQRDFAEHLPRVLWHHDEPLTHPNTLPIYLLARLAKPSVTVVLTGEGCDEFFGGYPRYRLGAALTRLGPAGRALGAPLARLLPSVGGRLGKIQEGLGYGPERAIINTSRYVSDELLAAILDTDPGLSSKRRRPPEILNGDIVSGMLEFDQRNYLLPILTRLDKASMAFSLEARVPFLDHRILEFAATVPSSLKVRGGQNKFIVKELASSRLPREVVYRKKSGLAMPLDDWLRMPEGMGRFLDLLEEPRSAQRGYLRAGSVQRLVAEHRSKKADHGEVLWGLLNLEIWQRVMLESTEKP